MDSSIIIYNHLSSTQDLWVNGFNGSRFFLDPLPFVQGPKKAEVSTTSTVGHGHKSLRGETTVPFKGLKFYRTIVASPQKKGVFPSWNGSLPNICLYTSRCVLLFQNDLQTDDKNPVQKRLHFSCSQFLKFYPQLTNRSPHHDQALPSLP